MGFIQQLKEHQDALDAIAILRTELDRTEAAGQAPVFAQTEGTFTNKLAEYEHLFEANAVNEFFQSGDVEIPDAHTDLEDFEYLDETASGREEEGHVYTHRDELDTEAFESTVDTAQFQLKSKAEVARLEAGIVKRQAYLEKLA